MEPLSALVEAVGKLLLTTAVRFDVRGADHIPPSGPVILAANHISYLDPLCLAYIGLRRGRRVRFLAMEELFSPPVAGFLLRRLGHIPVARNSPDAGQALSSARAVLGRGGCLGIFPEGGISRDLNPRSGQTGVARLAGWSGAPVVPVGLWGTHLVATPGRPVRLGGRVPVVVSVGSALHVGAEEDPREATDRIMHDVCVEVGRARRVYPPPRSAEDESGVRPPHTVVLRPAPGSAPDPVMPDPVMPDPVVPDAGTARAEPAPPGAEVVLDQQLRTVPFFRNLPAEALTAVAARLQPQQYGPGDVIFRQGDQGDTMFLVASGQVDVLAGTDATPLASLGTGSFVGELAVLLGEPRSATLRAAADSCLWALRRADLDGLLAHHPTIGVELSRELGRRLVATNRRIVPPATTRFTGIWGDGAASLSTAVRAITGGRVGVLTLPGAAPTVIPDGVISLPAHDLDPETVRGLAGRDIDGLAHLLIVLPAADTALARSVLSLVEHVVAFRPPPGWVTRPGTDQRLLRVDDRPQSTARAARWISGRAVGLALSSGGSKALAHLGVLRVLQRHGVTIDAVAGTSGGALVAAGLAFDYDEDRMLHHVTELAAMLRLRRFDLNVVPRSALFKGVRLRQQLDVWFEGRTFADTTIPCWAVATDVAGGAEVVIGSGPVADGVRASMSIPGAMNPWPVAGRMCIDGAVCNPMPASVLRDAGVRLVIGSNVAGQDLAVDGWGHQPHLLQIMSRMLNSMEREMVKAQVPLADIVIRPAVGPAGSFDFSRLAAFVGEGERAAEAQWPQLKAVLQTVAG